ncbi:MAG: alpha/beta hydrolase [Nanoarchaeota archaeon]
MAKKDVDRPKRVLFLRKVFKKIHSFDQSAIYYLVSRNNNSNEFAVLIHGLGTNNSLFRYEESFLIYKGLNVINVDLRGHGFSENIKGKVTLEDYAKDIKCILKEEKVAKAVLIGYSLGGFVSLKFYSDFPKLVKKMVLIDASYAVNLNTIRPIFIFIGLALFGLLILPARFFNVKAKQDVDFSKYKWRNVFLLIHQIGLATSLRSLSYAINAMLKENLSGVLKKVNIPTLIIEDSHDVIFSKKSFKTEHKKITKSELQIIEGSHLAVLNKSDTLEKDILNFIRK